MQIPGLTAFTVDDSRFLIDSTDLVRGPDVVLASDNADSGATPTTRFRAGNVIVKYTSDGTFVEANDSNADLPSQAVVTASEAADSDWASKTITVTINGIVLVTVTLGVGDDTNAEVVTALNADAIFAANCIASTVSSRVTIKTLASGSGVALKVASNLSTAFGASGTFATGLDPEVYVTAADADLVDRNGTACTAVVRTYRRGHFDSSKLIVGGSANVIRTAAPVAFATLAKQGAKFD